jgi:predicted enzyme related to lactoylglutathione lyase
MIKKISFVTIFVKDHDEAIRYYTEKLGFIVTNNLSSSDGYRWVTVAPSRDSSTAFTLVKADTDVKRERTGSQAAGHIFIVLETDDIHDDYKRMLANGVKFFGEPKALPYGTEALFEDLYGNRFDLVQTGDMI